MKKNILSTALICSLLVASEAIFSMQNRQNRQPEDYNYTTYAWKQYSKLLDWLKYHKTDAKVVLTALLMPTIYKALTTTMHIQSATRTPWLASGNEPYFTFGAELPRFLREMQHNPLQFLTASMIILPILGGLKATQTAQLAQENPFLIAAAAVLGTSMYLSSSEEAWLNRPDIARLESIDEKITALQKIYDNMSYGRYLMGGAIGLNGAIDYLKAQKAEKELENAASNMELGKENL
jgi:hypothetical protein